MAARHQIHIGNRRLGRDRAAIDATPAPRVGETLQLARERKGVDLFRAERDTKIRLRYLSALEDSDYDELPAAVYTKGFLRNYAIYLGLDPDELLERWREEMDALRAAEHVAVAPPPQPLIEPGGRRLTLTPAMLVAGLVVVVIVAFVGYIGFQLLRYAQTTPIALTNPTNVVSEVDSQSIVLAGTAAPGAAIVITGPGGKSYNTTADEHGAWSSPVDLGLGRNDFSIVSIDPVTQRRSDPPLALTINVPMPLASPTPNQSATAPPPPVLSLNLVGPTEGETSTDGHIVVRGTTSAERLTMTSSYLGTYNSTPAPSGAPTAAPSPGGSPPPIGPAREVIVGPDGTFAEQLDFPVGRWQLTITAYRSGLDPIVQVRNIVVAPALASSLNLVVHVEVHTSWVKIVADGKKVPGYGGTTLHPGDTANVTASSQICIRSGNAGALHVFVNDMDLGALGTNGQVGDWLITLAQPQPEPIDHSC
jgi:cytoskeletal protein RodZ